MIAAALTANALRSTIHGVNDLHSLRVGSIAGAEAVDYLSRQRIGFRAFPDLNAGLAAVKDGQLDAFVHDRPLLAWQIRQNYSDAPAGGLPSPTALRLARPGCATAPRRSF